MIHQHACTLPSFIVFSLQTYTHLQIHKYCKLLSKPAYAQHSLGLQATQMCPLVIGQNVRARGVCALEIAVQVHKLLC